jgi:ABC-type sugar transport system, periplasmic component
MGFANNPYWVGIQNGASGANEALRSHNTQVDWLVTGTTQDVPGVNAAVLAAAAQGYQGIVFFIAGPGNCTVIQQLSAQGIVLGVYNTLQPCVKSSGGLIDIAQAQYQAGINSAKELIKVVGNKKGEVGIITSLFSASGAEFRRNGFIDGLQGSNITPVNKGVEAADSAGTSFTLAQQFMTAVPDLVGIYCTAGGPFGAAQAVAAANKQDTIKVIGYDMTAENAAALKDGSMYAVTGQDAYGQTYDGVVSIFNKIAANQDPPNAYQKSFSPWVTKDNLSQYDPSTHPVDTLGVS